MVKWNIIIIFAVAKERIKELEEAADDTSCFPALETPVSSLETLVSFTRNSSVARLKLKFHYPWNYRFSPMKL